MIQRALLRGGQIAIDVGVLVLAFFLAFVLRFDWDIPIDMFRRLVLTLPYVVAAQLVALLLLSVHRFSWRYFGLREALRIAAAIGATAVLLLALRLGLAPVVRAGNLTARFLLVPIGVIAIDALLAALGLAGVRALRRIAGERSDAGERGAPRRSRRTLLVGAGDAGLQVARQLDRRPDLGIFAVGFVDDDRSKVGSMLHGISVLGTTEELEALCVANEVEVVLITIAAATGPEIRRITERCERAGLEVKTVPAVSELVDGAVALSTIRRVAIEDLLRRAPAQLDELAIARAVEGRTVLVTGAGGSIGGEICRQVCRFGPARLVLLDIAESPLFHAHRRLGRRFPGVSLVPVVGDVRDAAQLEQLFVAHAPAVVFHAAAYKHVPMMEWNPRQAVTNNIGGTRRVAEAAIRHRAEAFVLISTDKAVAPSSIMGATKRAAELVVRGLAGSGETRCCCVRFGNVLGSEGSVVPLFEEQIAEGGPVTVTHPDMERYFMTIPEACQLVMQAAAMTRGGEVFILDMGERVRIVDLARDLIRLSGLRPEIDVEIRFVGVRPGEKLIEELAEGPLEATAHPAIRTEGRLDPPSAALLAGIAALEAAVAEGAADGEGELRARLGALFPSAVLGAEGPEGDARGVSELAAGRGEGPSGSHRSAGREAGPHGDGATLR